MNILILILLTVSMVISILSLVLSKLSLGKQPNIPLLNFDQREDYLNIVNTQLTQIVNKIFVDKIDQEYNSSLSEMFDTLHNIEIVEDIVMKSLTIVNSNPELLFDYYVATYRPKHNVEERFNMFVAEWVHDYIRCITIDYRLLKERASIIEYEMIASNPNFIKGTIINEVEVDLMNMLKVKSNLDKNFTHLDYNNILFEKESNHIEKEKK